MEGGLEMSKATYVVLVSTGILVPPTVGVVLFTIAYKEPLARAIPLWAGLVTLFAGIAVAVDMFMEWVVHKRREDLLPRLAVAGGLVVAGFAWLLAPNSATGAGAVGLGMVMAFVGITSYGIRASRRRLGQG
jgi:hypothetical protein